MSLKSRPDPAPMPTKSGYYWLKELRAKDYYDWSSPDVDWFLAQVNLEGGHYVLDAIMGTDEIAPWDDPKYAPYKVIVAWRGPLEVPE